MEMFADLHPAQQVVAAVTFLKRITLEAVCGIAIGETDDQLNVATYGKSEYSEPIDAGPSNPIAPVSVDKADVVSPDDIAAVKGVFMREALPAGILDGTSVEEKRSLFYSWVNRHLGVDPGTMSDDSQWTQDLLSSVHASIDEAPDAVPDAVPDEEPDTED